jgi:lipoate-protein ligase B
MSQSISILNLGLKDYRQTYEIQKELLKKRIKKEIPDTLVLVEHHPVFTIGRSGNKKNIRAPLEKIKREGIEIIASDRGGDITYHGPGQIVGYPIVDLKNYGKDIHRYLRMLEEVIIKLLDDFDIKADRISGMTGVWVHPVRNPPIFIGGSRLRRLISNGASKKIASIGIAVSKWVTYHGFALNVEPNMEHFKMINSCGLGKDVTSVKEQLKTLCPSKEKIQKKLIETFEALFKKEKAVV